MKIEQFFEKCRLKTRTDFIFWKCWRRRWRRWSMTTKNRSVMEWIFSPLIFGRRDLNTFNYPQLSKFRRNQNWTWRSWFKSLMFGVWSLDRRDKETHSFEMESFILHCFHISLIILFLRNFLIQFQHSVAYDCDAVTYFDHVTIKSKSESSSGQSNQPAVSLTRDIIQRKVPEFVWFPDISIHHPERRRRKMVRIYHKVMLWKEYNLNFAVKKSCNILLRSIRNLKISVKLRSLKRNWFILDSLNKIL